ncbi:hypothetical protein ACWD6I_09660 [Streptomyces sp. NPDC002454]|uniref:hypothetical protein n=1 Tax=unclassified Streptomyces TaxID=2593676 RepID=UPI00331DA4EE
MTDTQDRRLLRRIGIAVAVVAVLPFALPLAVESRQTVNGEITEFSYLNLTALVAGVVALGYAVRTYSGLRFASEATTTHRVLLAVLVVVALFQLLRGSGVVPAVTECTASFSLDLCRPAPE